MVAPRALHFSAFICTVAELGRPKELGQPTELGRPKELGQPTELGQPEITAALNKDNSINRTPFAIPISTDYKGQLLQTMNIDIHTTR